MDEEDRLFESVLEERAKGDLADTTKINAIRNSKNFRRKDRYSLGISSCQPI